ncbi:MAG: hypothetical protein ACLGGX_11565 [Bdellovibrionia bacterium]
MLKNTLESSAISKLKSIVAERFGKSVEIRHVLSTENENSTPHMKGEKFFIPLIHEDFQLGVAIIPDALNLTIEARTQAADVVKLILEPTLYSWFLEQKTKNLEAQLKERAYLEQVELDVPPVDVLTDTDEDLDDDHGVQLVTNFIHLNGKNEILNKKVALQTHELAHRWAFIPFQDIKDNVKSVEDLQKLGAMTLWIENLELLTQEQLDLLVQFNETAMGDEYPLIITSSALSLAELEKKDHIPAYLIDEISINQFEVDRAPIGYPALKEVLELFFFASESHIQQ